MSPICFSSFPCEPVSFVWKRVVSVFQTWPWLVQTSRPLPRLILESHLFTFLLSGFPFFRLLGTPAFSYYQSGHATQPARAELHASHCDCDLHGAKTRFSAWRIWLNIYHVLIDSIHCYFTIMYSRSSKSGMTLNHTVVPMYWLCLPSPPSDSSACPRSPGWGDSQWQSSTSRIFTVSSPLSCLVL